MICVTWFDPKQTVGTQNEEIIEYIEKVKTLTGEEFFCTEHLVVTNGTFGFFEKSYLKYTLYYNVGGHEWQVVHFNMDKETTVHFLVGYHAGYKKALTKTKETVQ